MQARSDRFASDISNQLAGKGVLRSDETDREIPLALRCLDDQIGALERAVSALRIRLSPSLVIPNPSEEANFRASDASCDLAGWLLCITERLNASIGSIREMDDTCQL